MQKVYMALFVLIILMYLVSDRHSFGRGWEGFASGSKTLLIFKANWCGHCKNAKPEFDKLVANPPKLPDGSVVKVRVLDADSDKQEVAKYNVSGYPTILYINESGTKVEYKGERTASAISDFVKKQ
jgi:thiol-disulfide isomerase/thioredoxin